MYIRRRTLPLACVAIFSTPLLPSLFAQNSDDVDVQASIHKFSQIYEAVETNFADRIDPDRAVYRGAIPAMLKTLDPHSSFYDPKAYQSLRENQAGHYFGVGMLIGQPENKVVVIYAFEGSPAFRAGIRPGDQIVAVNDTPTDRADVPRVSSLLRGPRGTTATLRVRRAGS